MGLSNSGSRLVPIRGRNYAREIIDPIGRKQSKCSLPPCCGEGTQGSRRAGERTPRACQQERSTCGTLARRGSICCVLFIATNIRDVCCLSAIFPKSWRAVPEGEKRDRKRG